MNRVFKTKWSAVHQQYVVIDEHHATKGKACCHRRCGLHDGCRRAGRLHGPEPEHQQRLCC